LCFLFFGKFSCITRWPTGSGEVRGQLPLLSLFLNLRLFSGGWMDDPTGTKITVLDFAGGIVIHTSAGTAAVVCALGMLVLLIFFSL
jgi:hypothetical protein